jgi:Tol biopolymer transport system component
MDAGRIYLLDIARNTVKRLTTGPADEEPAWSGDESEVVFVRGGTALWAVRADGTGERKLVDVSALQ